MDSLASGVGRSQVVPYVTRLARRGIDVVVHSFEPSPSDNVARMLADAGVRWEAHPFGSAGARGGVARISRAAIAVRRAELLHARSDLAAAAALLARPRSWVWDERSLWADQRIALGMLRAGSPEDRVMRLVERRSAASASHIITLTAAVIPVLTARHGVERDRCTVIPTCVELDRFIPTPLPRSSARLLLSGTINRYYDVPLMLRFRTALARHRDVELAVLRPESTSWDALLAAAGAVITSPATPSEIPSHIAASHVGLSVCRLDAGPSLAAAFPTKVGEFLASGRPVVVNEGLGDLPALLREHRVGVVIDGTDDDAVERAAHELDVLLDDDDGLVGRCRAVAEAHFDVDRGVDELVAVYRRAVDG